jgi:hypothetical protein
LDAQPAQLEREVRRIFRPVGKVSFTNFFRYGVVA